MIALSNLFKYFKDELGKLKQKERSLNKASALCYLVPFINGKGILRVGGQIRRSGLDEEYMHPIILLKKFKVTRLVVKWCHLRATHRGISLNDYQCTFYNKISSV